MKRRQTLELRPGNIRPVRLPGLQIPEPVPRLGWKSVLNVTGHRRIEPGCRKQVCHKPFEPLPPKSIGDFGNQRFRESLRGGRGKQLPFRNPSVTASMSATARTTKSRRSTISPSSIASHSTFSLTNLNRVLKGSVFREFGGRCPALQCL